MRRLSQRGFHPHPNLPPSRGKELSAQAHELFKGLRKRESRAPRRCQPRFSEITQRVGKDSSPQNVPDRFNLDNRATYSVYLIVMDSASRISDWRCEREQQPNVQVSGIRNDTRPNQGVPLRDPRQLNISPHGSRYGNGQTCAPRLAGDIRFYPVRRLARP